MGHSEDSERVRGWLIAAGLVLLVLASHLLVVANPGYFSHDEWQKADFVRDHGLRAFAQAYGKVVAGPEFGYPVRPIGFLQQGYSGSWMTRAPVVPHLLDVLLHAGLVLLFWRFVLAAGARARIAALAAVVLAISPLGTLSTAWVAASFDRWYVLFALVAAWGWLRAGRGPDPAPGWLALIAVGSAGAILSKETAVVLPIALLVLSWALARAGQARPSSRGLLAMLVCASLPIAAYLVVRFPALQATLASHGGPYSLSPANLPGNLLLYFSYPFFPSAVESGVMSLLPRWQFLVGLALHFGLLVLLWRRLGLAWCLAYLAGFFVFLLPVLMLPATGAHYLYGSGPAFALAITFALLPSEAAQSQGSNWRAGLALPLVLLFLLGRSAYIQQSVYSEGKCQSEFLASYEPMAEAAVSAGARRLVLDAAPGTRDYVATKVLFGRSQFTEGGRWPTVRAPISPQPGDAGVTMQPDCRVTRR